LKVLSRVSARGFLVLALLVALAILGALLAYIKPPYPLAYALLTPILVLLLMLASPQGSRLLLPVILGFSLVQFIIGLILVLQGFRGDGLECFTILTLTSYTLTVFSLVNPRVSHGWFIFALITILWVLESRRVMLLGLPWDHIVGRGHIITLATTTLLLTYIKPSNPTLWRVRALTGVITSLLVVCLVEMGLVAGDIYGGLPDTWVSLTYIPVVALAILTVRVKVDDGMLGLEDKLAYTGLALAYTISITLTLLEVLGFATPELTLSMFRDLEWLITPTTILWVGVLAGSGVAAVGALILAIVAQHITPILVEIEDMTARVLSYIVALVAITISARREAKLYIPPLVALIITPLVIASTTDYTVNSYNMLAPLDSSRTIGPLNIRIGKPENLSIGKDMISTHIPITIDYKGLKLNRTLELIYMYDEGEGFKTIIEGEHRVEGEGGVMDVRIEVAPTLTTSLQTLYLASLVLEQPKMNITGSLIIRVKVYENIDNVNIKQLQLLTPTLTAILLELKPKITKPVVDLLKQLRKWKTRTPHRNINYRTRITTETSVTG
jgi:hypothetical protein